MLCVDGIVSNSNFVFIFYDMFPSSPLTAEELDKLASLLFLDRAELPSLQELETRFPPRSNAEFVTRVAPSPTGFIHIGVIYTALVNWMLAKNRGGTFILRIEDTDSKRQVEQAEEMIIMALDHFGLSPDEGFKLGGAISGEYGSYRQSERLPFYRAAALDLVRRGLAYPCFCSEDELAKIAEVQRLEKKRPGYYGAYAKWRDAPLSQIEERLNAGEKFVIRLRAFGDYNLKIPIRDQIQKVNLPENTLDAVILKSDGGTLYHLAHAVDDHFMRVTHVIRGDEWVSSLPLHYQLFQVLGFEVPTYAHLAPIQKLEEKEGTVSRRKLSKRKDPESQVSYYWEEGYLNAALLDYLANIADSNFEEWRKSNASAPLTEFPLSFERFNLSGALLDMKKIESINRTHLAALDVDGMYELLVDWSTAHDSEWARVLTSDEIFSKRVVGIEVGANSKGKRLEKLKDSKGLFGWFFPAIYDTFNQFQFDDKLTLEEVRRVLRYVLSSSYSDSTREEWFGGFKQLAADMGLACSTKEFKSGGYRGFIGDITGTVRYALARSYDTLDLYDSMQVLGRDEVLRRLEKRVESL